MDMIPVRDVLLELADDMRAVLEDLGQRDRAFQLEKTIQRVRDGVALYDEHTEMGKFV